ncbi:hypothetical protein F5I97DRAFT_1850037 [Phlebopus sp. FC_14]|nr:hypothetical protein F5I97DRAFT_1850037 [Phlebopus sp. FC_14]
MSSPEVEAPIVPQRTSKMDKPKKKSKSNVIVTDHGKNEGDDPHWAYKPPDGAVLLDHSVDAEPFEWDAIRDDDDMEIWLLRVPDSIRAKHLEGLQIDPPPSSRTARVGNLTRKNTTFDVWSIGDDDADCVGGEELRGLSCLLPRKKKRGKLCVAPKAVARHIVISAQPTIPSVLDQQPSVHQNHPRPSYSKDLLNHRFIPYGARSQQDIPVSQPTMDVDIPAPNSVDMVDTSQTDKEIKVKESKGKKRKGEGETPKRSKKHKSSG